MAKISHCAQLRLLRTSRVHFPKVSQAYSKIRVGKIRLGNRLERSGVFKDLMHWGHRSGYKRLRDSTLVPQQLLLWFQSACSTLPVSAQDWELAQSKLSNKSLTKTIGRKPVKNCMPFAKKNNIDSCRKLPRTVGVKIYYTYEF